MSINIQLLPWDSNFASFKIGKITLGHFLNKHVESIYSEAKKQRFRLVYIESNNKLVSRKTNSENPRLVDIKTTLRVNTAHNISIASTWKVIEYRSLRVTRELEHLAYESGVYSRFHIDHRFPDRLFRKLYRTWIIECVNKKLADVVYVCLDSRSKPLGFVTLKKQGTTMHIGLIAVAKRYRKKYIGMSLLRRAIEWSHANACNVLTITTQFNNISAMSLYQKCGFKIESKKYYYHYWIDAT